MKIWLIMVFLGNAHQRTETGSDVAATRYGTKVVGQQQYLVFSQFLEYAQTKCGGSDTTAGQSQADKILSNSFLLPRLFLLAPCTRILFLVRFLFLFSTLSVFFAAVCVLPCRLPAFIGRLPASSFASIDDVFDLFPLDLRWQAQQPIGSSVSDRWLVLRGGGKRRRVGRSCHRTLAVLRHFFFVVFRR